MYNLSQFLVKSLYSAYTAILDGKLLKTTKNFSKAQVTKMKIGMENTYYEQFLHHRIHLE